MKLLKAWSFYLSSFSSLIRCNKLSGRFVSQTPISISNSASILMASSLALFLMHLYHPNTPYDFRHTLTEVFMHLIRSGLGLCTYQAWGPLVYTSESLCQYPDWQSWRLHKRKILAIFNKAFIHIAIKGYSRVIHSTTQQVGDLQKA